MANPFGRAKGPPPTDLFAYSAVGRDTKPASALKHTPSKTSQSFVTGKTRSCSKLTRQSSASLSTSESATTPSTDPSSFTHARFAEAPPTTQPLARVERIVDRIITPYNADAYEEYLSRFDLNDKYPQLVFNLRNGFPIGNIPPLTRTYTPPNHKSALEHPDVISKYLSEECSLGRMSGPFSKTQIEQELGSNFVSCPLGLVEKAGEPGKFRIIRDLSYINKEDGYSVNAFLDADDFPTEWGTASQVAEIVSYHYCVLLVHTGAFLFLSLLRTRRTQCSSHFLRTF